MAQNIDIRYQEKAKSQPLNERFHDITGAYIKSGFRLQKGTTDFTISLVKGGFNSSIAVSPSGAKISETTDLIDRLAVRPNDLAGGSPRVDSVYLVYQFGTYEATADYVVLEGLTDPVENPNPNSHLLLGYIYVYPSNQILRAGDFVSMPYGLNSLEVAGESKFHDAAEFNEKVIFRAGVEFLGNTGGGGDSPSTLIERLKSPIQATENQTIFYLPTPYTMNTQTLFVYRNGVLQPPSEWAELDNKSFKFYDPMKAGEEVWAWWYKGISLYTPEDHDHDDLYYRKYEIANRSVRSVSDFFAGSAGRSILHYLGNTNYNVISVIATEKTANVGEISVEKKDNEIIVYNTGTYRGMFDLSYAIKAPYDVNAGKNIQYGDYSVDASAYDAATGVYKTTKYRRKDGTTHLICTLTNVDAKGRFTRLRCDYYNSTGTSITENKTWALTYDINGNITSKSLV